VHGLRYEPIPFVTNLLSSYGDIVRLPFGECDLYLLGNPKFILEIFLGPPNSFAKRKDPEAEQRYLNGILGFVTLFDQKLIPGYAPSMAEAALRTHQRWSELYATHGPFEVDIYREIGELTLEIVASTIFGVNAHAEAADLFGAILTMDHGYGFNPIEATLGVLMPDPDITISAQSEASRAVLHEYVQRLALEEQKQNTGSFLGRIVESIGLENAIPTAMSVLFAFHEVTATTIPWAWYNLALDPALDHALGDELTEVLGGRAPGFDDIPALPYTRMLLSEARRLYPVVWAVGRFVRQDVWFDDCRVPAGSIVLASQHVTHRDKRFYPDPERFDPARWSPEAVASRPEFSYFPFSAGPRACAGKAFADLLDPLVFSSLAQHWKAKLVGDQEPVAVPQKSSAPRPGIRMTLEPR
jgi:cytochrome P450